MSTKTLLAIKSFARENLFTIEGDANWSMGAGGLSRADIRSVLLTATECTQHGVREFVVGGVNLDGAYVNLSVRLFSNGVSVENTFEG